MVEIVEIICKLLFAALIIFVSAPYFHLHDKLFPGIIHDNVCSPRIPCLCLDIIVSGAVYDRTKVQKEKFAPIFLHKFIIICAINVMKTCHEFFQYPFHIEPAIRNEMVLVLLCQTAHRIG